MRIWECEHVETEKRTKINSLGSPMVAFQCLECGVGVGTWLSLNRNPDWKSLPRWDEDIRQIWFDRQRKASREEWDRKVETEGVSAFSKKRNDKFWEKYDEYLGSDAWRKKRNSVFQRSGGICEGCGSGAATQAHHLNYDRVGNEMLFDLVSVCDSCHEIIHDK